MTSQWDDDRIRITIKDRGNKSPITGLDEVGYVVQLHDHGPPGERSVRGVLLFDSESAHGTAGLFGDPTEARAFADRRIAAEFACQRAIEAERHARKEALSERQRDLWSEEKRQKDIAKAANKAAKEADQQARALAQEAESPDIAVSCNPSDDGWSLWVGPCYTDGTQGGDPRQMVLEGHGMLGPRKIADDKTPAKRQGKDPKAAADYYESEAANAGDVHPDDKPKAKRLPPLRKGKPAPAAPQYVPDSAGLPIALGSRVTFLVADGEGVLQESEGSITKIGGLDPSGVHMVEIESDGKPYDALATECTRVQAEDMPMDEQWPDIGPEAA
jgi:hypothetical protein